MKKQIVIASLLFCAAVLLCGAAALFPSQKVNSLIQTNTVTGASARLDTNGVFTGSGAGLTNIPSSAISDQGASLTTITNFVINQIYTNANKDSIFVSSCIFHTLSAVAGSSEIDLMYSQTGGVSYTAIAKSAIQTTALSVAQSYTNWLGGVITNLGNFYFTNTSSGAGDSAGLVSGTGQYTVFGGVGATGPTGAQGPVATTNFPPQTLTLSATNVTADFTTNGLYTLSLSTNCLFASSNLRAGCRVLIKITGDTVTHNLYFPAAWIGVGAPVPGSTSANKIAELELYSWTTADSGVTVKYAEQP